jgi:ABC-type branched-subunit amino acid transport system ATPase component
MMGAVERRLKPAATEKIIAQGPPRAIQKNPEVIAAYLGTDWQT